MAAKHTLKTLATTCFIADDMAASKCYAELLGIDAYFVSQPAGGYIEFCISDDGEEDTSVYNLFQAA
ncbi:hypothetical protein [Mucilaginibacter lappiensis]|uniref:Glyoxalase/Bleomycin resistance protein/Dioxygenase superfamily protein n=1 Tax=Mucilaginibacter lappiensis TaxID=354630 RepID=A0A1N7G6B6_9SPHI|nr:hypothetical protein [Mucilaginibacter lappiensis]MBB6112861.1 hypothetical protein [Mucilaginibacter lappiensis]MBB6131436.1 hypothetical protein [Mucilaginibacter lappiensis]SIS07976.1 hypothetical protein SAMN05421821_12319 [Mucilaginibacter lappiensis]